MPISPRKKETDYTFELIADNIEDWEKWINKYSKKSPKSLDKKLSDNLQEHGEPIIQKLEARKAAKLREEIRLEKAKIFEMIPRKKSRRLVVKSEEDDKKRQLEEMERAQIEYEILQREQEIKEQEEQLEREKQAMQIEEARLREEVYQLIDSMIAKKHSHNSNNDMSGNSETDIADNNNNNNNNNSEDPDDPSASLDEAQLKQLRSKLKKSATYDEMIGKLKGWATLLNDDYQIYLADEEESYIDVEMKDSQPIANMDIDQSKTENTSNNNSNNSDNSIRLDQQTIVQNSDINDGQLQKTEPQEKIYATMENNILSSPPPPSSSVSISKTEDKPISTSENIFSKTLSLQNTTQPVDNSNVIIMNNNMEKNKEINNDNNDINSNSNIIDTNPKPENNESVLVTNDTITIPDIQSNIDESNYTNGLESQKTVANKELREQQQLISDNNNNTVLAEPQSESVPMDNINESFNIIKSDLHNNSNNTKSTTKSKRGRPRKSKKTFITKQMTLLTFTQVIQFYGNGTRSDLRDPLLKLILSTILTHLRSQPVIIDMEKRNEKKIGKKRKNTTNTVPPTIDFYTVHKKLLLDQYNEKESNMDQRQGIDTTTATTITNNNIDEEVIEFAAFEKWLYDMDILFLRNDKPFLEFKKHAYEVFLSVFKY
ncbi:hypothetical protein BJ944DRAFT_244467 [Cunninghamella echinulata]|nr:hypothetical protein BJ944DRAFT_244467 [Cunninghamella echinulata]